MQVESVKDSESGMFRDLEGVVLAGVEDYLIIHWTLIEDWKFFRLLFAEARWMF